VWRARRIAAATRTLPAEGAAYVDAQVAPTAHRVGLVTLDRLVEEAMVRFDPEEAELRAMEAAESRHVDVQLTQSGFDGVVAVYASLDVPDAIDLEDALVRGAAALAEQGSTEPLPVRRAKALGMLARGDVVGPTTDADPKGRRMVLHVHTTAEAMQTGSGLARVENTKGFVLLGQLSEWCMDPARQVDVLPVIDLAERISVDAYEVPERLARQAALRDLTCVFPGCCRPARRCDCDHVVPYARGGPTCTCNIAPLCRGHHRLKTRGGWFYEVLEPGSYLWTSPLGYQFLRDHRGTLDLTSRRPPPRECSCASDPPRDS